jgi:hypothetical protein
MSARIWKIRRHKASIRKLAAALSGWICTPRREWFTIKVEDAANITESVVK